MKPINLDMKDPLSLGMGHPTKERVKRLTIRKTNRFMRYGVVVFILAAVGIATPISPTLAGEPAVISPQHVEDGYITSIDFDLTKGPPTVQVEIDDKHYTLLVMPAMEGPILLNSSVATELGLENRESTTPKLTIDTEAFDLNSAKVDLKINDGDYKSSRVFWTDRDSGEEFDGFVSGRGLGFDRVSFSMPIVAGKKYTSQTYKTVSRQNWGIPVNMHDDLSKKVVVVFTPHQKFSRADLVLTQNLKQDNFFQIENAPIVRVDRLFGVERQAAKVAFSKPLSLFGQTLETSYVQVHNSTLETKGEEGEDVVTITGTKTSDITPVFKMGLDALGSCVKIEFMSRKAHIHCEAAPSDEDF